MTHLSLVPESPAPATPQAVAPPPRGFPYPTSEFYVHGLRLAPSRLYPDRIPAPPGGRAHITEDPRDLAIEQAVLVATERLARGRALVDELGQPVGRFDIERFAGMRASGLASLQARLRPHLRRDHPWTAQAQDLVERLAVEEAYWWGLAGRRRT
ncbi:hypothetical protein HNR00_003068 [Methylorubrum rhodinum]|uniref:Uncharacterized protein n=1 Tax=Methylorubrum rhodinum TaxID=29428 RepID=A0A840ZMQ4_9HYPH|nr:hypothetical protein [Methylorubrum rhodinum]MBB5758348.1 hypothetical protein [Methylorubrum rhodinum]